MRSRQQPGGDHWWDRSRSRHQFVRPVDQVPRVAPTEPVAADIRLEALVALLTEALTERSS